MACDADSIPCIELETAIGFEGSIPNGLKCHPDGYHLIYAVGNAVVIEHVDTKVQIFLQDICSEECNYHRMKITCLDLSACGKYIAAGTQNLSCSNATVVIWCYDTKCMHFRYAVHRYRVEALAFTCDEAYLLSLGGPDDRCVTITDVENKKALCTAVAQKSTSGNAQCIATAYTSNTLFVTGGRSTLRVWEIDMETYRMKPTEVFLGKIIRHITCLILCNSDEMGYAGTTSGDIITFNVKKAAFTGLASTRCPFEFSITQMAINCGTCEIIVGSGTGLLAFLNKNMCRTKKEKCFEGRITSIVSRASSTLQYYIGTDFGNIYRVDLISNCIKKYLLKTSHYNSVNDIAFPCGESDLLVAGSRQEVRVWSLKDHWELLRILVPNFECLTVHVTRDGKTILTGWDDSRIRAYYPESGASMYIVNSAYGTKVTALTSSEDSCRIISGSDLGHVVVWKVPNYLEAKCLLYVFDHILLKEHRAPVTDIKVRTVLKIFEGSDTPEPIDEIMSCSMDGTLIVWNVRKRLALISIKTHYCMFKSVVFDPCCLARAIATGTGGKLTYWELCRGIDIYQCDDCGSRCDINSLDIECSGQYMVTGDDDRTVKMWRHGDGKVIFRGYTHSAPVNRVKFSPNRCRIVSASNDGAIFIWRLSFVKRCSLAVPCVVTNECRQQQQQVEDERCQQQEQGDGKDGKKNCEKGQGDCCPVADAQKNTSCG